MNYLHTLHTFLEHHFTPSICTAEQSCEPTHTVPTPQLQQLLTGLSHNQFENLICYLIEEGHILHATKETVTFCPLFICNICNVLPPSRRDCDSAGQKLVVGTSA